MQYYAHATLVAVSLKEMKTSTYMLQCDSKYIVILLEHNLERCFIPRTHQQFEKYQFCSR